MRNSWIKSGMYIRSIYEDTVFLVVDVYNYEYMIDDIIRMKVKVVESNDNLVYKVDEYLPDMNLEYKHWRHLKGWNTPLWKVLNE